MSSMLSVVYAWARFCCIPAVLYVLVAQVRPPRLGWPRQDRVATIAAWVLVACVPISGFARLGEFDVVGLAGLSVVALGKDGIDRWRRGVLIALWVVAIAALQESCGTLVLTRLSTCMSVAVSVQMGMGVVLVCWLVLVVRWPRTTIPQRMTALALVGLVIEYGRQLVWLVR